MCPPPSYLEPKDPHTLTRPVNPVVPVYSFSPTSGPPPTRGVRVSDSDRTLFPFTPQRGRVLNRRGPLRDQGGLVPVPSSLRRA